MPLDPSIPLQFHPTTQLDPPPNALAQLGQVLQMKHAIAQEPLIQQQIQTGQLENQQRQIALKNAQDVQAAFSSAQKQNPDGTSSFDMDGLKRTLSGTPGGLEALTHIGTYEKGQADLAKVQNEVGVQRRNVGGSIGASVGALIDDPLYAAHMALTLGTNAVANKTMDPQVFAPIQQVLTKSLEDDPTGQAAAPILKRLVAELTQNSPEQQKLANEKDASTARLITANTGTKRLDLETPGIQARTTQTQNINAGTTPVSPAQKLQNDIAQANSDRAAAAQTETARHNAIVEKQGTQRLGLEGQRLTLDREKTGFDMNGGVSPAAQMAADGKMDPSTLRAMIRRTPGIIAQIKKLDPNFDEANIENRFNTLKDFTNSSVGKPGGQLIALNTMIHHADLYMQTAEAMKNGSFTPGNAVYNTVSQMMGSPAPNNAALVARFFAGETGKVATGGVPAEGEINGILKTLGTNASPEQMQDAGKKLLELASGRATPLLERAKQAKIDGVVQLIGPDAQDILKRRGFDPKTMKPVNSAGSQGAPGAPPATHSLNGRGIAVDPKTNQWIYVDNGQPAK